MVLTAIVLVALCPLSIPPPSKLGPKRCQLARLILLDIQQFLRARIPQWRVSDIFCALVHGRRVCRAQSEGGAVGQRDELGECIRPFWAPEQGRMADLLAGDSGVVEGLWVEEGRV